MVPAKGAKESISAFIRANLCVLRAVTWVFIWAVALPNCLRDPGLLARDVRDTQTTQSRAGLQFLPDLGMLGTCKRSNLESVHW